MEITFRLKEDEREKDEVETKERWGMDGARQLGLVY